MTDSYTASVVGAGTGGRLSLNALAASERYKLVAACDMRAEVCRVIEEMYPGIRTFTSHKEMLAECPTEVVCVHLGPFPSRDYTGCFDTTVERNTGREAARRHCGSGRRNSGTY